MMYLIQRVGLYALSEPSRQPTISWLSGKLVRLMNGYMDDMSTLIEWTTDICWASKIITLLDFPASAING